MSSSPARVLIVDDDSSLCESLSTILEGEGYRVMAASTGDEAREHVEKANGFDVALVDLRLPDESGIRLLEDLQVTNPEAIKIIITGFPSLENSLEALDLGADSFLLKPIDPRKLLEIIRRRLDSRKTPEGAGRTKLRFRVKSMIEGKRFAAIRTFVSEMEGEFASFGLTANQAKIYVSTLLLGLPSVSEVSDLSGVRREEVYRITPHLEKLGLMIRQLRNPIRFSATRPKKALDLLIQDQLRVFKERVDLLHQKRDSLVGRLESIDLPKLPELTSTEIIVSRLTLYSKAGEMISAASRKADLIGELDLLKLVSSSRLRKPWKGKATGLEVRAIAPESEVAHVHTLLRYLNRLSHRIELRTLAKLPFSAIIVDDREASWGNFAVGKEPIHGMHSNDPMQVLVLATAFERVWREAAKLRVRAT